MDHDAPATPAKGHQYERSSGTLEVVFAVEDGRVLTFREYPSIDLFHRSVADAQYTGENSAVKSLPGVDAFRDLDL
ncbi:hypothetical protein ACH9L7_17310 (plasmid) [Haloferax sp. S1W]|uniref:hypothetical protein n=1 Tax=Haloferax sp. S1W TaxID=3377110 RepID=UPI0037C67A03